MRAPRQPRRGCRPRPTAGDFRTRLRGGSQPKIRPSFPSYSSKAWATSPSSCGRARSRVLRMRFAAAASIVLECRGRRGAIRIKKRGMMGSSRSAEQWCSRRPSLRASIFSCALASQASVVDKCLPKPSLILLVLEYAAATRNGLKHWDGNLQMNICSQMGAARLAY